jgi:hypothetical protein
MCSSWIFPHDILESGSKRLGPCRKTQVPVPALGSGSDAETVLVELVKLVSQPEVLYWWMCAHTVHRSWKAPRLARVQKRQTQHWTKLKRMEQLVTVPDDEPIKLVSLSMVYQASVSTGGVSGDFDQYRGINIAVVGVHSSFTWP